MRRINPGGIPAPPDTPCSNPRSLPFPRLMHMNASRTMTLDEELLRSIIGIFTMSATGSLPFQTIVEKMRGKHPDLMGLLYNSDEHLWSYIRCYTEKFAVDRDPCLPWNVWYFPLTKIVAKADRRRYNRELEDGNIRPVPDTETAWNSVRYDVQFEKRSGIYFFGLFDQLKRLSNGTKHAFDIGNVASYFARATTIPRDILNYVNDPGEFLTQRRHFFKVFGDQVSSHDPAYAACIRQLTLYLKVHGGRSQIDKLLEHFRSSGSIGHQGRSAVGLGQQCSYDDFVIFLNQFKLLFRLHTRERYVVLRHDIMPEISDADVVAVPRFNDLEEVMMEKDDPLSCDDSESSVASEDVDSDRSCDIYSDPFFESGFHSGKPTAPKGPLEVKDVYEDHMTLEWQPPDDDSGMPIDHYEIEQLDAATGRWDPAGRATGTSFVAQNLQRGHLYTFRIKAGAVIKSEPLTTDELVLAKNPYDEPEQMDEPKIADWGKDHVVLEWQPPANDGGAPVTGYVIEKKDKRCKWVKVKEVPAGETKTSVDGLDEGEEYQFRIAAVNEVGPGQFSEPSAKVVAKPRFVAPKINRKDLPMTTVKVGQSIKFHEPSQNTPHTLRVKAVNAQGAEPMETDQATIAKNPYAEDEESKAKVASIFFTGHHDGLIPGIVDVRCTFSMEVSDVVYDEIRTDQMPRHHSDLPAYISTADRDYSIVYFRVKGGEPVHKLTVAELSCRLANFGINFEALCLELCEATKVYKDTKLTVYLVIKPNGEEKKTDLVVRVPIGFPQLVSKMLRERKGTSMNNKFAMAEVMKLAREHTFGGALKIRVLNIIGILATHRGVAMTGLKPSPRYMCSPIAAEAMIMNGEVDLEKM